MLVLPTRQCASRPVPPLTSPFIILYVAKRCGGRKHVNIVNSCGRSSFCGSTTSRNGSQRVATGRNGRPVVGFCLLSPSRSESQRAATGVNVLVFTCEVPAAASRSGASRKSKCWVLPAKSEPRQVATGLHGSQIVGVYLRPACLPAKSEPRRVATGFNGSPSVGFRWRLRNRGESQLGQTRFDKT